MNQKIGKKNIFVELWNLLEGKTKQISLVYKKLYYRNIYVDYIKFLPVSEKLSISV